MSSSESTSNKAPNPFLNRLDVDGEDGDEFVDHWETGELLFLSSSVLQSDRNWVSVARSIKSYGESNHPSDWYAPKNCALQYTKLLDEIENDTVKKALPRTERETPEAMLVKNLTEKRLSELEWLNQQTKAAAETLRMQIESVENGDFDDNLDELLKDLEDQERRDAEHYNEYLHKRENLNKAKKLNRSRITRGKSTANNSGLKKKTSVTQDIIEEFAQQLTAEDIYKNVKIDIEKDMPILQSEVIRNEDNAAAIVNAQLNSPVSVPSSFPQSSPLLTSLLSSVAFPSSDSQIPFSFSTPIKKPNVVDDSDANKDEMDTMDIQQECSPNHSEPKTPPSTSDSSPLLNSLLKNSQSTSANLFASPGKEISPIAASSPRPFFNPTSALATAAAQQLAVATSATLNELNFQQLEIPENHQTNLQFMKATSACSAAPTLSKLLEMPPSTPGKLPPLPIVDSPISSTLSINIQKDSEQTIPELCLEPASKIDYLSKESSFPCNTSMLQKSMTSYSLADKRNTMLANTVSSKETQGGEKTPSQKRRNIDGASQESIDILEAVCESIDQAFEEKERQKNLSENKKQETNGIKDLPEQAARVSEVQDIEDNKFCIGEISIGDDHLSLFEEDLNHTFTSSDRKYSEESVDSYSSTSFDFTFNKSEEVNSEEDRKASEKKFYRSRSSNKKEDSMEKNKESFLLESSKESIKSESEISATSFTSVISSVVGSTEKKQQDSNSSSPIDSISPVFKNVFEKDSIENMEMIQVEVPVAPRTYSRRGKRRRGRPAKSIPIKQVEPEDQYEFTESTEENSVVYRSSKTLCYMPRVKEDFHLEDSKGKAFSPVESEGRTSNSTSPSTSRKNLKLSSLNEEPSSFQSLNAARALFGSDERISDSLTSDETSNPLLNEDKFKKWEETCEENDDASKSSVENSTCLPKVVDVAKKKCSASMRSSRRNLSVGKGRRQSSAFLEEMTTRSGDSEEMLAQNPVDTKEKNFVLDESLSISIKSDDSHLSYLNATESNKQIDDVEECESPQGSITTVVSPPSINDTEGPESLSDKQDLYNIVSPKYSETISQSSDESEEDESDNWDSQSASTNKSSSHSSETGPRLRRKERDTAEYKAWKKAISFVLREASCHKNANIFLQKVTNDVAPGYLNIVHRPMDLSLIKKNIDTGVIRTTDEFHRDMLLMFQNAIMYNSSDHDVHQMAVEMQRDVVKQINAFLATQSHNKEEMSEPSSLRGARTVKSHKRSGKQLTAANSSNQKDEMD